METVLITGGTGLVGRALTRLLLQQQYNVIVLSQSATMQKDFTSYNATPSTSNPQPSVTIASWNVAAQTIDVAAVQQADYIIHLAGANVADKRWTKKRKQEILESRTESSTLLVKTLKEHPNKVKALVSASAIGWYGPDQGGTSQSGSNPGRPFIETDPPATDFLGQTCLQWEQSIDPVELLGKRLVKLRTGIVLSAEGGALKEFMRPLNASFATIMGNGRQMVSWIHIDDLCRMYLEAIQNENWSGVYNAVSIYPVNNKTLVLTLAKALRGKRYNAIHIPVFLLKLVLGEMSIEVLKSVTVSPDKIRKAGFNFAFPSIEAAVGAVVAEQNR